MKPLFKYLCLILVLTMCIGTVAACSSGTVESVEGSSEGTSEQTEAKTDKTDKTDTETEAKTDESKSEMASDTETESNSETDIESDTESETAEIIELDGIYGDSILYADKIKNGVQSYYPNGVTRTEYYVENLNMQAEFALKADSEQKVTYIKNKQGNSYVENTMDVFIRMKDGKTYFASDSSNNARVNMYRIGYYYYDARILEQSFFSGAEVTKEIDLDEKLFCHYNASSISGFKIQKNIIRYTVSGSDPYFSCRGEDINIPFDEYSAIRMTIKSTSATQAQLFVITDKNTSYNAKQSIMFNVLNDGEFHTYDIMLNALPNHTGKIIGFRLDLGTAGEMIEVKDLMAVKLESDAPYVLLDRTWHTYPDKVHQELHFVAPDGQDGIDAVGMITEIPESTVAKLTVKDKNGRHDSIDGVDWASAEYIGFDIKNAGIFGYIMPFDGKGGSFKVTLEDGNYVITQEASPKNGEIRSPVEVDSTKNDFFTGQRIYTDYSHSFDAFIKEAEWERHPLTSIESDNYAGYDSLRGAYLFNIGGTDFNSAFFYYPNKHFEASISIKNTDEDRPIYIRTATTSGGLEGAALLDKGGLVLPIPLEVSKNFGEGEEPVMNYSDESYGETVFPFVASKNVAFNFSVLNLYQNWGRFPLKQLSSIAYYAPYYHLSVGITETTCISPWYVRGRTLWTLPDFRSQSAPYWFELEGSAFRNEPQHSNAGVFEIIQYTDADGNFIASENYKNVIDSSGPVYAEVKMDYISDDGKMKISYNHLEMPQTDELRPYYEIKIDVLEDISFKDFKNDFAFYAWDTVRKSVGYLDADGNHEERKYSSSDSTKEYVLGKVGPYFGNFGIDSNDATNLGFLIHSYDFNFGGKKFDGNFVVVEDGKNRFCLSLNIGEFTLKKGDSMTLNILMIPWGSHLSKDASNLAVLRQNSVIDPFKVTATKGEVIDSVYMPRVKSTDGKSAEFTLSGGANNVSVRVYGFNKLTAPKIYEKIGGEWVEYVVSSINTPDSVGTKHYYDGYSSYYDGDGTYSYAFVVNMDDTEARTFKIEAIEDFKPWPEIENTSNDPIEYLMDAKEMSSIFSSTVPGVSEAILSEDESFIRIKGDGKGAGEVSISVFNAIDSTPTGKYVVFKYRMPSTNKENNNFEIFTSTINSNAKGSDSIWIAHNSFHKDDNWHVVIVDPTAYRPDTFVEKNGKYYAQYIRFDVFNTPMSTESYVDIAYVGICDTIEELCELNSDMETMTLFSKTKVEQVNVKTGEVTLISGGSSTPSTPTNDEGVTVTKNASSLIASDSSYTISTVPYFGRIDTLCGIGPKGEIGKAYDAKGSNSTAGVAVFEYNNPTTKDMRLVFAGWSLIYGGVDKYVWSADGGKTWQEIELYNRSSIGTAGSGMIKYANDSCGKTDFDAYAANSSYQGSLKGPDSASGLAADLTAYSGRTVNVIFAAVPKTAPNTVCILAKVNGVKVETDGEVVKPEEESKTTTITTTSDAASFIAADNAQGYSASKVHYFARVDTINGYGTDFAIGAAFDMGSNDKAGISKVTFNTSSLPDKHITIAGWNLVEGGVEKYVWSADGGKTWNDATEYKPGVLQTASTGMIDYTKLKYGDGVDFSKNLEKSCYQGALTGPSGANGLAADLSAYAGKTVDVTFAVVPASDTDSLCILLHITGVKVAE